MAKSKRTEGQRKRQQLLRLWEEQKGKCHYCKRPTILIFRSHGIKFSPINDDLEATVEHLRSRYHKDRQVEPNEDKQWKRRVMACRRCNGKQNDAEQAAVPKEELHRRSGHMKKKQIEEWFDRGVANGHTHLIVVCDTFEPPSEEGDAFYPIYVEQGQDAKVIAADYGYDPDDPYAEVDMQRVMEVYNLRMDKERQINAGRQRLPVPKPLQGGIAEEILSEIEVEKRVVNF